MISIVHGGHREGLCYNAAQALKQMLEANSLSVKLYSLRNYQIEFCCGDQTCQDSRVCVHSDIVSNEIIPSIVKSSVLAIFTPTYFNSPPAILKNFIDRCNLLLTNGERNRLHVFGWISGQTNKESLEQCWKNISVFAEICEYNLMYCSPVLHIEQNIQQLKLTDADREILERIAKEIIALD